MDNAIPNKGVSQAKDHTAPSRKKGYRLVGANALKFNFIFVKNGIGESKLPEVSVESVLQHPLMAEEYVKLEPINDWEYMEG